MQYFLSSNLRLALVLFTLLALPVVCLQAQSIPKAEADSLLRLLQVGKWDTNRVNQLVQLGEYQVYKPGEFKEDMDSAKSYARQAHGLSRRLKHYQGEARSLNLLGTISRESKKLEQSIAYHLAALGLYQQYRDWKGEADSYLLLAWTRRDQGDATQARNDVQQAINIYTKNAYQKGVGQAYLELGNTYANWGEGLSTKISYYQQASQWFAKANDTKRQADAHKDLGDLYMLQGSNVQAMLELRKALNLYRSIHFPQLQGVYDLLGNVSSEMGNYRDGLKYGLLAVQTAESLQDTTLQLCTIYNRLSITYFYLKQYQKVLEYLNKAMMVAQQYNDQESINFLTSNIANVLFKLDQPGAALRLVQGTVKRYPPQNSRDSMWVAVDLLLCYTQLKQYVPAQQYCNQLLSFASGLGKQDIDRKWIYNAIIPFFIANRQHGQARKYLAEYKSFCTDIKYLKAASDVQLYWFRLDSVQAHFRSAIGHYQQYKRLEDSLLNEAKNGQMADLDVLYETEKKEQDLKLKEQSIKTLSREKQLQAKQLEQDRLWRNGLATGAGLLLLLVGVIYNHYRLKQRSNRQLQAKQVEVEAKNLLLQGLLGDKEELVEQKEWLLKEVHHRVRNNLQIIISLLQAQGRYLSDEAALNAINQSKHRMRAMALIHQKLYHSDTLSTIDVPEYLQEVVEQLAESYDAGKRISFQYELAPLKLDVVQAVPLGLILNEAVTNTLRYAFPEGKTGKLRLSLRHMEEQRYELVLEDDGVGLPPGLSLERSHSMGAKIMRGLSKQLEGSLKVESQSGVKVTVTFQVSPILDCCTKPRAAWLEAPV
jgi:two-component sensor histidine kinase